MPEDRDSKHVEKEQTLLKKIYQEQVKEWERKIARMPLTLEKILEKEPDDKEVKLLMDFKKANITHFFEGLITLNDFYHDIEIMLPEVLPAVLSGNLLQPDGSGAKRISVNVLKPYRKDGDLSWPDPRAVTTDTGYFRLELPGGTLAKAITLEFRGNNGTSTVELKTGSIGSKGKLGNITLPKYLDPLDVSIVEALSGIVAGIENIIPGDGDAPDEQSGSGVSVKLGEEGEEGLVFNYNLSREKFPYGVLIRLIEPKTSVLTHTIEFKSNGGSYTAAMRNLDWTERIGVERSFSERVPVDEPLSIDNFRDQLIGSSGEFINIEELVPMAGTLGLGYIVRMAQHWKPCGLSLGNLVYSLPLAPGEQQRVAVFEQQQTFRDYERDTLEVQETLRSSQVADTSAEAIFESAFREQATGTSYFETEAQSWSAGGAGGIGFALGPVVIGAGGGGAKGGASSSGSSYNSLEGSRHYVSHGAQSTHSGVEQQASVRRRVNQTSMRLASASDLQKATTRVITNNNRAHAMTVQFWEVLRHFDVSTAVEGVNLVCFVPLEVVRFLPPGEPVNLDPDRLTGRRLLLRRYSRLLRHADILKRYLPPTYRQGLDKLEEFMSNPHAELDFAAYRQEVLRVQVTGAFLPFEEIYVTVRTRYHTRLRPVRFSGGLSMIPPLYDALTDPEKAFSSRSELVTEIKNRRNSEDHVTLTADIALPATLSPDDIVGFDISRNFRPITYNFAPSSLEIFKNLFGDSFLEHLPSLALKLREVLEGVSFSALELEREFGGPFVSDFKAFTQAPDMGESETFSSGYITSKVQLPAGAWPVPALMVKPTLRFNDLLQIEKTLQHVIRNTIYYSKAVWQSLTDEERAVMLEGYTIGVPEGGITDDTRHIPLLNCVANQVLGFYGNSMIMPFNIPPEAAGSVTVNTGNNGQQEEVPMTTGMVQEALAEYHRKAFKPPVSRISLPTRGVLGEAVLGRNPSAEKIDITRFWNWQDSPVPEAGPIGEIGMPQSRDLIKESKESTFGNIQPIINNLSSLPSSVDTALLQKLADPEFQKGIADITGMEQLSQLITKTTDTAEKARESALKASTEMASKALDKLPAVMSAINEEEKDKDKDKDEDKDEDEKEEEEKEEKEGEEQEEADEEKDVEEEENGQ